MDKGPPELTPDMPSDGLLVRAQAELILAAGILGRSQGLVRLFRFLLKCTLEGRTPKELEIADEVFGRSASSFEQDASIRVHIHRLRRKLDEYYRGAGAGQPVRLVIPKADYRLAIEFCEPPGVNSVIAQGSVWQWRWLPPIAALLVLAGALGWWLGHSSIASNGALEQVRASALWQPVVANSRRVAIVVGDYYIFGERDKSGQVTRLVREFDVNSPKDLERLAVGNPERAASDVDLGLNYLPVGIGNALRAVTPVMYDSQSGAVPLFVIPASKLSPERVKYTGLVYLGYLSGLGALRDPLFSNSRFAIGGSYDEIIDRQTGRTYAASSPLDLNSGGAGQDFAIVSSFRGVTNNPIIVIAGTRDAGLMQAAEFVTRSQSLAELSRVPASAAGFEALLAIESLENVGLRARLVAVSPRRGEADWSGANTQSFPDSLRQSPAAK